MCLCGVGLQTSTSNFEVEVLFVADVIQTATHLGSLWQGIADEFNSVPRLRSTTPPVQSDLFHREVNFQRDEVIRPGA
jgi:hypothetical protein